MDTSNKNLLNFGYILGAALVISVIIGAFTFSHIRSQNTISTTGSAKVAVTSDKVKWISNIQRQVKLSAVKDGYAKIDADVKEVRAFLATNGITDAQVNITPVYMNEVYEQYQQAEKSYNLSQTIEVNSDDVQKIKALSQSTAPLVGKGILFSTNSLEYYYSKLPEARIELLDKAVADAKARAEKLAGAGGKKVGALKTASSGVVQVMSPNSVEVSDYGMYNTQTIEKEIMVTVKATFDLN
jgi:hypothetical protein